MWSVPNFIPLSPDSVHQIWRAIKPFDFHTTYGLMGEMTVVRQKEGHRMELKERVLESAKIATRAMGYREHAVLEERL
jgi:hypothetical protein